MKCEKLYNCMDKIPVVKLLQLSAALLLVLLAVQVVVSFFSLFTQPFLIWETFANGTVAIIVAVVRGLFQPAVLLALAEIVKAKKQ